MNNKLYIFLLALLASNIISGQTFSPVANVNGAATAIAALQTYPPVKRGERPPVDIDRVAADGIEPGIIRIKFKPQLTEYLDNHGISKSSGGAIHFGLAAPDALNRKYSVSDAPATFSAVLQNTKFFQRHREWGLHLWYDLIIPAGTDIKEMVREYARLGEVAVAEPVYRKQLIENVDIPGVDVKADNPGDDPMVYTPDDPEFVNQWHYNNTGQQSGTPDADIDLPEAWDITKGNSNVIVAVIDQGIEAAHVDLAANIWPGIGYNFVNNSPTITPGNHGTHVAGTIAANTNNATGVSGVAGGTGTGDGVRLMSCEVFGPSSGSGGFQLAPIFAADNGACISQNSWGYTNVGVYDQAVLDAIDYFNANGGGSVLSGGITIFAAGNSNAAGLWYPGCYSGVVGVAATNNNDVKAWYSNYDSWVDIAAPGGETNTVTQRGVLSSLLGNTYGYYQGTSMACPHVSGVAALIVSLAPGVLTAQDVRDILVNTTDNIYPQNPSFTGKLGSGRLNAFQALQLTQFIINPLVPQMPLSFNATAVSSSQIDLTWAPNAADDSVVLVFNSTNTFGTPDGHVITGDLIPGGGTVLYTGQLTSFSHTGLNAASTYFYRLYSKNGLGYSYHRQAGATTLCDAALLPLSESFNNVAFPVCWSQQFSGTNTSNSWNISATNLAGGTANEMKSTWQNVNTGTFRLVTPRINTLGVPRLNLSFKHMLDAFGPGVTLRIQSSTDGITWTNETWSVALTAANIPATTVNTTIDHNVNSPSTYIAFTITGNLINYDYWYIDDVQVSSACPIVYSAGVSISASANPVCTGTEVTLTAVPDNGGTTPVYQWYVGSDPVGSGSDTYTYTPSNGDVVSVTMTTSEPCALPLIATSNVVTMTVSLGVLKGVARYGNNPGTPLDGLKITLTQGGSPVGSPVITGASGYYEFSSLAAGTYDLEISSAHGSGQWQTWGGVNNTDYLLVSRHAAGISFLATEPPVVRVAASVRAPHPAIDLTDANAVRLAAKYGWGSPTPYFEIPKWMFSGVHSAQPLAGIAVNCATVTRDIRGLCAGDVNGSYVPPTGNKQAVAGIELVHRGKVPIANEMTFPVRAESDMEIGAITVFLDFDASRMEIIGVEMPKQGEEEPYFIVKDNTLQIGWVSLYPIKVSSKDTMFAIHARVREIDVPVGNFSLNANPLSELADGEGMVIDDIKLAIADPGRALKGSSDMVSVYPNPVSSEMNIEFQMEKTGEFHADLVNLQGVVVLKTISRDYHAGLNKVTVNLSDLPNGAYMLKAVCDDQQQTTKVIVNR